MTRKAWVTIAIVAGAVLIPVSAVAATGTFSSASSATALTATNTSSGIGGLFQRTATTGAAAAIQATNKSTTAGAAAVFGFETASTGAVYGAFGRTASSSGRGVFGWATHPTGLTFGVSGQIASTNADAAGVFGRATATSGFAQGVFGKSDSNTGKGVVGSAPGVGGVGALGTGGDTGVGGIGTYEGTFGLGTVFGVEGSTYDIGDGSYGVVSDTDLGVVGHIVGGGPNVAGTCTVPDTASSSATCPFDHVFPSGTTVLVMLTPTADPGDRYWVTNVVDGTGSTTGFVAHLASAAGGAKTFNYIVVGIDTYLSPFAPGRGLQAPARLARFEH